MGDRRARRTWRSFPPLCLDKEMGIKLPRFPEAG
jgi:hypothetical protein